MNTEFLLNLHIISFFDGEIIDSEIDYEQLKPGHCGGGEKIISQRLGRWIFQFAQSHFFKILGFFLMKSKFFCVFLILFLIFFYFL